MFYSGFYTPLKKKVNTFSNVLNKSFKTTEKLIMRQVYKFKIQNYRETLAYGELKSKVLKQEFETKAFASKSCGNFNNIYNREVELHKQPSQP